MTKFSISENYLSHCEVNILKGYPVLINSEEVVVNDDQTFSAEIHLDRGINTITIEASRRYSRKVRIERTVLFNPDTVSLHL